MANYLLYLLVMMGIYSILAYSINLVTGFGGLITFCHAAFYGVGAYAYALLRIGGWEGKPDLLLVEAWSFLPALAGAALTGALVAFGIGWCCLRFRGDFFVFATIGFQMIVFAIIYNSTDLTMGSYGLRGIPRPELFGWQVQTLGEYVLLVAGVNVLILSLLFILYRSPFGLSLKALRENERAAESLGISSRRQYLSAIVLSGACAAVAGGLFASYVTYIDPTSFTLKESIFILTLLLLGGGGNIIGPMVGVFVMLLLPEGLRFLGVSEAGAPNIREMLYGAILIGLMYFRPQGIAGSLAVR